MNSPVLWLFLAWTIWQAASIIWSEDQREGLEQLGAFRVILVPWAIWPVLHAAPCIIGALLLGVLGSNLVQAGQHLEFFGLEPDKNDRLSGFLHVGHTGAMCVAALGWHLVAAIRTRGGLRWASIIGFIIAGAGLAMSGSRGPWLAGAACIPLALVVLIARRPALRRRAVLAGVGMLVLAGAAWPIIGGRIIDRIDTAVHEYTSVIENEKYTTDTGVRIFAWRHAWTTFSEHPVTGIGAGGFRHSILQTAEYERIQSQKSQRKADRLARAHPHSVYLYVLASGGAVGGVIVAALIVMLIRQCWRDPPDHIYGDGALIALITWLIGALFDCYNLNGHMFGLLVLIAAVTLAGRGATSARVAESTGGV